jgi:hypothetical protein
MSCERGIDMSLSAVTKTPRAVVQHCCCICKVKNFDWSAAKKTLDLLLRATDSARMFDLSIMYYWKSKEEGEEKGQGLVMMLRQLWHTFATDSRDKVYAAFGLSKHSETITIDYSLPVEENYMHISRSLS